MTIPSKRYLILLLAVFAAANVFVTRTQARPCTETRMFVAALEAICVEGKLSAPNISEMKVSPVPSPYPAGLQAIMGSNARLVS